MTSKKRVQAAIARRPVDREPMGFYAVDHDTVSRVLGRPTFVRNKIEVQIALWEGRRDELAEGLKTDTVEFYRKIDCADILLPKEAQLLPPRDYEPERIRKVTEDRWEDARGRVYQLARDANEVRCVQDPTLRQRAYSVEDFEGPVDLAPPDPSIFEVYDHVQAELGEERYVASPTGGVTGMTLPGGMETGLMLYASQPEVILAANRRSVAVQNERDTHYIRRGAPGVLMEQDTAGTNGPLVSPGMFRTMCYPFLKERMAHVKQSTDQIIYHNCGDNVPLMDMFIDCGIDCYQSLQTTAGMEPGRLKGMFGDRISFWGGVPVELLIGGSTEEVRLAVKEAMDRGAPGGGFILGPSHSIAMGTKYENFMAMLDEFDRLRDRY